VARRTSGTLREFSRTYGPTLAGWWNYFGSFYPSSLQPIFDHFDLTLARWIHRRSKRLRGHRRRSRDWVARIAGRESHLFGLRLKFHPHQVSAARSNRLEAFERREAAKHVWSRALMRSTHSKKYLVDSGASVRATYASRCLLASPYTEAPVDRHRLREISIGEENNRQAGRLVRRRAIQSESHDEIGTDHVREARTVVAKRDETKC
jgi:hypothetical protein